MLVRKSAYYDRFACLAGACPDSCCKDWTVQVDPASAAYYRSLPGELGRQLRGYLADRDGETVLLAREGRCPLWRADGLCRLQAELGERALCRTCRDFPRLTHDYGDFRELGLELSCPAAAALILNAPAAPLTEFQAPGGSPPEYDRQAMALLLSSRDRALGLLGGDGPVGEALALTLMYGIHIQQALDGEEAPWDPASALDTARDLALPGDPGAIMAVFQGLEVLTDRWAARLRAPSPGPWDRRTLALARYFVQRYWLQAVSDGDLYGRVKLLAVSCLLLRHLGGDFLATAQLFSKEVENDAQNVEALLDGAYRSPAFADRGLLGLLLEDRPARASS